MNLWLSQGTAGLVCLQRACCVLCVLVILGVGGDLWLSPAVCALRGRQVLGRTWSVIAQSPYSHDAYSFQGNEGFAKRFKKLKGPKWTKLLGTSSGYTDARVEETLRDYCEARSGVSLEAGRRLQELARRLKVRLGDTRSWCTVRKPKLLPRWEACSLMLLQVQKRPLIS